MISGRRGGLRCIGHDGYLTHDGDKGDKLCSDSLDPSSSHINRAELVLSISLELMEMDPARHQSSQGWKDLTPTSWEGETSGALSIAFTLISVSLSI